MLPSFALISMLLLVILSLPANAAVVELPYSKPYMLVNDSIVGLPIGAGNTFFVVSIDGRVYANGTLVFRTISPPSTLDFDPSKPMLAIGTRLGEIVVVNGSSLVAYTQAFAPIESIWLLDESKYVAVLAGSRMLVYQLYKAGWYEISHYKSTLVSKRIPLKIKQMVASKKAGGKPGSWIAVTASPALFKQVPLEVSGLKGDIVDVSIEVVVPEYGYSEIYRVANSSYIQIKVPVPLKKLYLIVHVEDKCGIKIVDLKSYKYEIESPISIEVDALAYGVCPEFGGTGVFLFDASLSNISSLWIPVKEVKLLSLFEDKDRFILVASKGEKLVIVVKKGDNVETYTYLLPARPTCAYMFDSNYIFIGCANGEVFIVDAITMKLAWSRLFTNNSITWLNAVNVDGNYIVSVVDDTGKLVVGALTDKGIILTGYAELKGLPEPFKRVELWRDSILLASEQGYVVVEGLKKFTKSWGNLLERVVKNVEILCVGERNETVKAKILVYYKGKLVSETIVPGKTVLLVNENHTLQVIPFEKHYTDLIETVKIDLDAKSTILLVPYKYYDVMIEVYDDYGVQGHIEVYVNNSLATILEGKGQSSVKAKLKLKYGCYNITLSGPPVYQLQTKIVCIEDNLKLPFKLIRIPSTLTILFENKPIKEVAVEVYCDGKLVAQKLCSRTICSLNIVRGYNMSIIIKSLEKEPYYETEIFRVNVLYHNLTLPISLKPKQYEVEVILRDSLGKLLCPVEVYLDDKYIGVAEPDNPVVKMRTSKGVHRLAILGFCDNLRVYSEEHKIVIRGSEAIVVNVTRIYTPLDVVVVDSFTGKGPLEDIVLSSGNYSVIVNKSVTPVSVKVYVYAKEPIIRVRGSKVYSDGKISVNLTEEKLTVKLIRKVVSAQINVVDDRGNPLDAKVVIRGVDVPYSAMSESVAGIAVFSAPIGVYEVCVQAPFYEEICRELDLAKTLRLEVTLKPTLVELVLRNTGLLVALAIFVAVSVMLYRKRRKILESIVGGESEEELF